MKVGFIGLGSMGAAMASNLLEAGHAVTVWNRSEAAADPLVSLGAKLARSPERAVQGEVVHSMLADDAAVRAVFLDGGLLDAMDPGTLHVNHATISLELVRDLVHAHAERGLGYLAAPVFGRPDVAAAGKLNIVAAGAPTALAKAQPLLDAMAAKVWLLGEAPERANAVKIAGNFMLATAIESMAEASALIRAHGIGAPDFLEIMTSTLFAAPAYQGYGKAIAEERYSPAGMPMRYGLKDVKLALAAGEERQVGLPLAGVVRDHLLEAIAAGDEALDWAALARAAARRAHLADEVG